MPESEDIIDYLGETSGYPGGRRPSRGLLAKLLSVLP
jgi:hypothetical protein